MSNAEGPEKWEPDELRRRLQAMDDYDFEFFVADIWERQGWTTEVEQQSADAGVDVRATKSKPYQQKVLIQAKRYSEDNPLGGPDIQQYSALKQQEQAVDKALIVTTGRFTGSAEDRANDLNVKLIDGEDLVQLIDRIDAYDIVEEYLGVPTQDVEQTEFDDVEQIDSEWKLPTEDRKRLESAIDGDLDEYFREQQYKATRALERAQGKIRLNPHDAYELGMFEGIDEFDVERDFEKHRQKLPFLKDDIHIDDDGEIFVGDVTEYVPGSTVDSDANEAVVGILERGVGDEEWVSGWTSSAQVERSKKKVAEKRAESAENAVPETPDVQETSEAVFDGEEENPGRWWIGVAVPFVLLYGAMMVGAPYPEGSQIFELSTQIGAVVIVVGGPIAIYSLRRDLKNVRENTRWSPGKAYMVGMLMFGLSVPFYLWYRWKHLGQYMSPF